jgi:predicted ATPase/class 3 adenylate cyclase
MMASMAGLFEGTVTLLFTDIEGSTRLLERLGEAYADTLAEHRRLVRKAVEAHGGVEVDTQGDAFFCAFARARDAVDAASDAQRSLAPTPVRARMGIHTGEPALTDEGYVGLDVHRGARICSAAHGGQIVVSSITHDLLDGAIELRDLGTHRLKDLVQPQRLYQVVADGLELDFPPPRSDRQPSLLPKPVSSLIGRVEELAAVVGLVRGGARLVTLTGPGGTGKTRLAIAVASELEAEFADGAAFVELAPVAEAALVLPTIGVALGVNELSGQSVERLLGARRMLLVLDNLEHLLAAAPEVAAVLKAGPGIVVLTTSRAPLHLTAERVLPVSPLPRDDAVELFVERAHAAVAPEIAELCAKLDGLPLAIELAAARASVLSPAAILARLENRLSLLTSSMRDVPDRQRTLRAAIEWSCDLLDDDARRLFARLSVFAGGFTLEAAEALWGEDVIDALAALVDHSLLHRDGERFWMLETIREFARELLAGSGEEDALRERHAEYFIALAENAYTGRVEAETRWADALEAELDNLRAALDVLDHARYLQLAGALGWFFHLHSRLTEGAERLDKALTVDGDARHRARALTGAGTIAGWLGRTSEARERLEAAIALWHELGEPVEAALAFEALGWSLFAAGEDAESLRAFEEALELQRAHGTPLLVNRALVGVCQDLVALGDIAAAEPRAHELLELARREDDVRSDHFAHHFLADCALIHGDYATADDRYRRSLLAALPLGDAIETSFEIQGLAMAAAGLGHSNRALVLGGAASTIWQETGTEIIVPFWNGLLDGFLGRARESLSPDEGERAWEAGRSLSFERAVEEALEPAAEVLEEQSP